MKHHFAVLFLFEKKKTRMIKRGLLFRISGLLHLHKHVSVCHPPRCGLFAGLLPIFFWFSGWSDLLYDPYVLFFQLQNKHAP
jgi:hypothetical protein